MPSCNPDSWGEWSACSGTEETQVRTNACGTVETEDCPRIAGTVYYDANSNCSGSGWSSGGVAVSLDGGAGNAVSGTGTFTLLASSASLHTLAVSLPPGYTCSTAAGCNSCSRTGIISPSNNNFFYLTNIREAWWQAEGAGVYAGSLAGGVTVRSELPSATPLIAPGPGGAIGALLRASGTVDVGSGVVSTPGYNTLSRYRGKTMNYAFFAPHMGVLTSQPDDWSSYNLDAPPAEAGQDFYYMRGGGTISAPWSVAAGASYVIFVNGELRKFAG